MTHLRLNLRLKFIVLTSLLILLTSLALSQFVVRHLASEEEGDLGTLGLAIARNLAYNAELGVLTRNGGMLADLCRGPLQERDVTYVRVVDRDGETLASLEARSGMRPTGGTAWMAVPPHGEIVPVEVLQPGAAPFRALEVRVPVTTRREPARGEEIDFLLEDPVVEPVVGETIGSVVVGLSLASAEEEAIRVRRAFGWLTAVVVLLGVATTVGIVHWVVTPIQRLVLATRRIAEGNLDQQVEMVTRDEIGDLGRSFNRMTEQLRRSRSDLEAYSAGLEEKVRQRTEELERAQSQLIQAEKMSAMGELVSGVAHELNNPLAGVLGYSQLLMGTPVEERVRRGLDRINREAERCKRIVQNLQVFARKHKPQKNYIGINGVIESTLELRAYQLQVDDIQVVTDLQPELPKTMADFHQLQQVFMNLLVNAHQAIKSTGRPGRLEICTRVRDDRIVVRLSDNGCGIPEENLGKLFDPFFTTKEVGQGTGLGLSICYGIVQEHRGRIYATGRPEEGATFVVELPILAPPLGAIPERPEPGRVDASAAVSEPRRSNILVIDDEESILDVLHQALQMDGHRVDTAQNGRSALRKIRTERYDVIISDLKMPGMNGMEFYDSVRDLFPDMAKRIVFSTGDVASCETRAFLERSGNAYLQKPFDLAAIRRVVADVLSARLQ